MVGKIRRSVTGLITAIFAFLLLISGAYCQEDANEPNSELGDATEIDFGEAAGGYISPKGDADYYKFFVENPGILEVELSAVPDEMRTRIDFYGKNFNWITRTDASNPGDLATLKLDLANSGWYYVGISDLGGKLHNAGYSFQVALEPVVDLSEPNNVLGDATKIDFGEAVKGYIFTKGDVDFYKFYVNSSGILEVKLDSTSPNVLDDMRTRIDLYGKNFNWITRTDASNPGDLTTLKLDLVNPGWYYVGISDLGGKSHKVEYAFHVEFEPVVDKNEPDSEIGDATKIDFDKDIKGHIFTKGDGDFYKFYVNSSGILEVELNSVPDDMRARIDFYGKDFNWITRTDASNPCDLTTLKLDLANSGWYYVGIGDLGGKSHNIEYTFQVAFKLVVDSNEPNSEIGDATEISFGDVAKGFIFPKGDGDFYKLRVDRPGALEVKLIDSPGDMRARIDLYGKNFNWISRIDASNPGDLTNLKQDLANPGWYYLGISDLEGKSHNVEHSFQATLK